MTAANFKERAINEVCALLARATSLPTDKLESSPQRTEALVAVMLIGAGYRQDYCCAMFRTDADRCHKWHPTTARTDLSEATSKTQLAHNQSRFAPHQSQCLRRTTMPAYARQRTPTKASLHCADL